MVVCGSGINTGRGPGAEGVGGGGRENEGEAGGGAAAGGRPRRAAIRFLDGIGLTAEVTRWPTLASDVLVSLRESRHHDPQQPTPAAGGPRRRRGGGMAGGL